MLDSLERFYPDSIHVRSLGLARATDAEIWDFAAAHGFVIVSKDSDFRQLSFLYGAPPKIVWIASGNCSTAKIELQFLSVSVGADDFR